jgi:hypothetical protein
MPRSLPEIGHRGQDALLGHRGGASRPRPPSRPARRAGARQAARAHPGRDGARHEGAREAGSREEGGGEEDRGQEVRRGGGTGGSRADRGSGGRDPGKRARARRPCGVGGPPASPARHPSRRAAGGRGGIRPRPGPARPATPCAGAPRCRAAVAVHAARATEQAGDLVGERASAPPAAPRRHRAPARRPSRPCGVGRATGTPRRARSPGRPGASSVAPHCAPGRPPDPAAGGTSRARCSTPCGFAHFVVGHADPTAARSPGVVVG